MHKSSAQGGGHGNEAVLTKGRMHHYVTTYQLWCVHVVYVYSVSTGKLYLTSYPGLPSPDCLGLEGLGTRLTLSAWSIHAFRCHPPPHILIRQKKHIQTECLFKSWRKRRLSILPLHSIEPFLCAANTMSFYLAFMHLLCTDVYNGLFHFIPVHSPWMTKNS